MSMKWSVFVLPLVLALPIRAQCPRWADGFDWPGFDAPVEAIEAFDAGSGPELYAGGSFLTADGRPAHFLARFDGTTWREVGGGLDGYVTALHVFDDGSGPALYVGGNFANAGGVACARVAKWNGTSFTPLGAGFDAPVLALGDYDDGTGIALYAGGTFTGSGPATCRSIARFDGTQWSAVGGGIESAVEALEVFQGELVAAGSFVHAGPAMTQIDATGVARWNGSAWSTFGASGLTAAAHALAVYDPGSGPRLYVGGDFDRPSEGYGHLARWSGTAWESPGAYVPSNVHALRVLTDAHGLALVVGGASGVGLPFGSVLRIAGNAPSSFQPATIASDVRAIAPIDRAGVPSVCVGGVIPPLPSFAGSNAALLGSTSSWSTFGAGEGLSGIFMNAVLEVDGGALEGTYLAASAATSSSGGTGPVFRWDGAHWSVVGPDPSNAGGSYAIAFGDLGQGERLFGTFDGLTGPARIRAYDGATWSTIGTTADSLATHVYDAVVCDLGGGPELYVTGSFTSIDGVPANRVARFDGTSWHALGAGLDQQAFRLCVFDDGSGPNLVVRGLFANAGGSAALGVARWNGTSWFPMGAGLQAAAQYPDLVVVKPAGAASAELYASWGNNSVRRWDGSAWVLAGTMTGSIRGLAAFDDGTGGGVELYAVGTPTNLGPVGPRFLRFDGTSWTVVSTLTTTTSSWRYPTLAHAGHLWIGDTSTVDGKGSRGIARFEACGPVSSFCAGDGVDAHVTTSCPCGNVGGVGRGCAWSGGASGALLAASGDPALVTLVLLASGMPASGSSIFLKGDALIAQGVVFGDGVRCVDGSLIRLGTKTNVAGSAQYPEAGNASIATRGMTPIGSGAIGTYQTYFRNAASFCTSATFNVTNGVRVVW